MTAGVRHHHGALIPNRVVNGRHWRVALQTASHRVYASERLSLGDVFGKAARDSHGRQPDSGNPTVRDETGGLRKHGYWRNCEPILHIERAGMETLRLRRVRLTFIPTAWPIGVSIGCRPREI